MGTYGAVLLLHSLLRWAVLALCLVVVVRAFFAWRRSQVPTAADDRLLVILVAALDVQFLSGLWLYFFLSPVWQALSSDFGAAMRNPLVRFFGVEHVLAMVLAVAAVHAGRVAARKASTAPQRHRRVMVSCGVALLLMLAATPWPFLRHGRPLLRAVSVEAAPSGAVGSSARTPAPATGGGGLDLIAS